MLRRLHAKGDRGVLVIEAALVFPLFLTLLFGIVDIGYAEFQTSQATAAARDGARAGILSYKNADVTSSSDYASVVAQVNGRLGGQPTTTITVKCLSGLTGSTVITCSTATQDADRIQVVVSWTYAALTPIMSSVGPTTIRGTATMAIIGTPTLISGTTSTTAPTTTTTAPVTTSTTATTSTTTTTPGGCSISNLAISPAPPLDTKNSTKLQNDYAFTVTTNGSTNCTNLRIQFPATGNPVQTLTFNGGSTWSTSVDKNAYSWSTGTYNIYVQNSSGTTLPGGTFSVTVT